MGLKRSLLSLRRLRWISQSRRLIRAVEALVAAQQEQNGLLRRLADEYAPVPPAVGVVEQKRQQAEDAVTFLDPNEMADILNYREKVKEQTGHEPTEDECIAWLAERETLAWTEKLIDRQTFSESALPRRVR